MSTETLTKAAVTEHELNAFIVHEARLIDEKRFDDWFDLFTDDAIYWMPLARDQQDPDLHASLFNEDKLLLKLRIERLKSPRSFSQQPPSFCHHLLQHSSVEVFNPDGNEYVTRTPFHYAEAQGDNQFLLAGWAHHTLTVVDGALRIRRKKVELINCEAALPSIQLFP